MKRASEVGDTIMEQMGGFRRLQAMLGIYFWKPLPNGVEFGWPNKNRAKGNHLRITLAPDDTYTLEFMNTVWELVGRQKWRTPKQSKLVKKLTGVYAEDLKEIFENQTGWYIRMGAVAMPGTEIDPEKWKDILVLLNVISNRNLGDKSPLGITTQAFLTRLRQKILQEEGQALRSEALGVSRRLTPRFDTMLSASKRVASAFLARQTSR